MCHAPPLLSTRWCATSPGLPPAVFAATVPNNYLRNLRSLLEELAMEQVCVRVGGEGGRVVVGVWVWVVGRMCV